MNKKALITILVVSLGINVGLFGMFLYRGISEKGSERIGPRLRPPEPRPERHLPGRPGSGPPGLPKWFESECKITDQQKEDINKILEENNEKLEACRRTISDNRKELFTLINKEDPNLEEIDKKIAEISALELDMEKIFVRKIISVRGVLTPDQVKLLDSHIEKYMRPGSKYSPGFEGKRYDNKNWKGDRSHRRGWSKNKTKKWGDDELQVKEPPQSEVSEPGEKEIDGGEPKDIEK
ncbi:MAG: Spy/CpxP family protein refolding chaperone [Deltaproteobacteria bacterium]|uniref:Spy/CpxP family protein refolding chaperone n=1 Tax=Candidatus Zymogenus saltonus TaxID=2844893 RepID=A0A9D8KGK1_9DELT|nr:Spy/CpxP family protein refolding chaperone [Candidatus Zymogenus saltonus]